MADDLTRRQFVQRGAAAVAAAAAAGGLTDTVSAGKGPKQDTSKILNYNCDMEYRRLGKTGLMISAVVLGGHWKRVVKVIGGDEPRGWMSMKIDNKKFQKNRYDVMSRCIERGFNYVDACCREEILPQGTRRPRRRHEPRLGLPPTRLPVAQGLGVRLTPRRGASSTRLGDLSRRSAEP